LSDIDKLVDAVADGDMAAVKTYLEEGCDINGHNKNGWTPAARAIYYNHQSILEYLVKEGADVEAAIQAAHTHGRQHHVNLLERIMHVKNTPEWSMISPSKLAHVEISEQLNRQITEVFNFASGERFIISENLKTNAESMTQPTPISQLPEPVIREVLDQFKKLGGKADEGFIMRGTSSLTGKSPTL
jgi:hypothetical protein